MANDRTELLKRITIEDGKCGGRPCIRGKRMRVSDVLDLLAAGAGIDEILKDYPFLEREDILAVFEYAARQIDHRARSPRLANPQVARDFRKCIIEIAGG